jgi:hypothetical protein
MAQSEDKHGFAEIEAEIKRKDERIKSLELQFSTYIMMMEEAQAKELKRRESLHLNETMIYGYECNCGHNFLDNWSKPYMVDGITYPIISNETCYEGGDNWTEDHMCPKCKIPVQYSDGT